MARQIDHPWIGKPVRSKAVGSVSKFDGIVESAWRSEPFFHVRDAAGNLWHRTRSELSIVVDVAEVAA